MGSISLNFSPFPVLETERLLLRQLTDSDAALLFMLRSDETVNKYINREPPNDIVSVKAFISKINTAIEANESLYWVITVKPDMDLAGTICLWNFPDDRKTAETGYELMPTYQGRGIMQEALAEVINYAFTNLNMQAINAFTHKENKASAKLLEKQGFVLDRSSKDEDDVNNCIYRLFSMRS